MFKDDLTVPLNAAIAIARARAIAACSDTNEVIDDLRSLKSSEASLIPKNKSLQVLSMLKLKRSHICGKLPLTLPKGCRI